MLVSSMAFFIAAPPRGESARNLRQQSRRRDARIDFHRPARLDFVRIAPS
ncbi:hypothetical protein WJ967_05365 [Achromobacter xylosoxidans]